MTKRCAILVGLLSCSFAPLARAERLVSAFDPRVHVRPPTMKALDGNAAELVIDADFLEAAERYRAAHPNQAVLPAPGDVRSLGEVIIVEGNVGEILTTNGSGFGLQRDGLQALARKVISTYGDNFQAITLWMTFEDQTSMTAEAYEVPVKNEVEGLGSLRVMDQSGSYGSSGVLRSILNMKTVGLRSGETAESWRPSLETWGQESAHRWMVFMLFRDTRTGKVSDAMLGRQCSHYSKFVDTQASIHDGFAWRDNGDGTFTWTESSKRYGDLDLYGMGLMGADEVAPFFLIDGIAGYTYPTSCSTYQFSFRPPAQTIRGTRVDISIADIIAANGERKVPTNERQDYWREAEVVLTSPSETLQSSRVQGLVNRIEKARGYWEDWNREASRHRLVMCTKITGDCGDPRSDVGTITFNSAGKGPQSGPLNLDIQVVNSGERASTGIKVGIETKYGAADPVTEEKDLGELGPGATRTQTFKLDLKGVPCGTEIAVKAHTQSEYHFNRSATSFLLGAQEKISDAFEQDSGWTVDPDGDDTQVGATWERGTPEASMLLREQVQPGSPHGGEGAWVTGLAATSKSDRAALVRLGKATLQSPLYDTKGLQDPLLRYWVSFVGVRAGGGGLEGSAESQLLVQARATDAAGAASAWTQIDAIANDIAPTWVQRSVTLPKDLLKKARIQFRFVASDGNPEMGGVEAAIDDVAITSNLAACYQSAPPPDTTPPGGCGCRVGGTESGSGAAILLIGIVATLRRRRR